MAFDFYQEIETLSHIAGISGREEKTAEFFRKKAAPLADEVRVDKMGNVCAFLYAEKENAPTILIDTHCDEVGFLVTEHLGRGFVKLAQVGGIDPGVLPASEILLHGKRTVRAVVSAKPPHLRTDDDAKKKQKLCDLVVDTLLSDDEARDLCPIGTPAGFSDGALRLLDSKITSRTLDDRVGGLVLLKLLETLNKTRLRANVALLFSVQEEVGGMGAMTAAFSLCPDVCLCVDVSFSEFPGQSGRMLKMGGGTGLSYSDTLSRTLTRDVLRVATEQNIPVQLLSEAGETGTNAHEIQVSGHGVPSTILSLPLSYMHSPSEVVDVRDLQNCVDLIAAYCYHAAYFPKEVTLVG